MKKKNLGIIFFQDINFCLGVTEFYILDKAFLHYTKKMDVKN